jgi:hypothetical protein
MSTDLQMLHSCDGVTKNYKSVITYFYDTFQCIVPTEVTLKWAGHGEERNTYKILLRKLDGRTSLRRSMHRWEDNTKMDLREIDLEDAQWSHLVQNRDQWWALVNTVINLWDP